MGTELELGIIALTVAEIFSNEAVTPEFAASLRRLLPDVTFMRASLRCGTGLFVTDDLLRPGYSAVSLVSLKHSLAGLAMRDGQPASVRLPPTGAVVGTHLVAAYPVAIPPPPGQTYRPLQVGALLIGTAATALEHSLSETLRRLAAAAAPAFLALALPRLSKLSDLLHLRDHDAGYVVEEDWQDLPLNIPRPGSRNDDNNNNHLLSTAAHNSNEGAGAVRPTPFEAVQAAAIAAMADMTPPASVKDHDSDGGGGGGGGDADGDDGDGSMMTLSATSSGSCEIELGADARGIPPHLLNMLNLQQGANNNADICENNNDNDNNDDTTTTRTTVTINADAAAANGASSFGQKHINEINTATAILRSDSNNSITARIPSNAVLAVIATAVPLWSMALTSHGWKRWMSLCLLLLLGAFPTYMQTRSSTSSTRSTRRHQTLGHLAAIATNSITVLVTWGIAQHAAGHHLEQIRNEWCGLAVAGALACALLAHTLSYAVRSSVSSKQKKIVRFSPAQ